MIFPLDFDGLTLLFAVTAVILLVTSEVISLYPTKVTIFINKKKLRYSAIAFSVFFLITVAIRIIGIVLAP